MYSAKSWHLLRKSTSCSDFFVKLKPDVQYLLFSSLFHSFPFQYFSHRFQDVFPFVPIFSPVFLIFRHLFPHIFPAFPFFGHFFPIFSHSFPKAKFPPNCTERRQMWSACGRKWIPSSMCGKNAAGFGNFRANLGGFFKWRIPKLPGVQY